MKTLVLLVLATGLSGCAGGFDMSMLGTISDRVGVNPEKATEIVGKIEGKAFGIPAATVAQYCDKVPEAARGVVNSRFNARPELKGNRVDITCAGE